MGSAAKVFENPAKAFSNPGKAFESMVAVGTGGMIGPDSWTGIGQSSFEDWNGGGGGSEDDPLYVPNTDFSDFDSKLAKYNSQFFNTDFGQERLFGVANQMGGISGRLGQIGFGGRDPRFDEYARSQFNIFESGAEQQRRNQAAEMARRGLGGSSVALNQMGNIDASLAQQRQALGSQLGLQSLGRQDQALRQALGGYGQQAGVLGQYAAAQDLGLNSITAGLQNTLAKPALEIAKAAAINAGRLPPEEEPGLLGGIFDGLF